jgi:hypothetical protein
LKNLILQIDEADTEGCENVEKFAEKIASGASSPVTGPAERQTNQTLTEVEPL